MRYRIALATAIVLVCGFLAWKSSLIAGVHREFAKRDLTFPPEGIGTEMPKQLELKIVLCDFLQSFQIPIVTILVAIPIGVALVWPRAPAEESTSLPTENRNS
jgi:hypothetical protein